MGKMKRLARTVMSFAMCLAYLNAPALAADISEEVITVPVSATGRYLALKDHPTVVTVFKPSDGDANIKHPFIVFNHGRPVVNTPSENRMRLTGTARYFAGKGYVVFVPTRPGYGVTKGPDIEDDGSTKAGCEVIANSAKVVAEVNRAAISYAAGLPYVDAGKGLIVGQSAGGFAAIYMSTLHLQGIKGIVNFSGGRGGNPTSRPGNPVSPYEVERCYSKFGSESKLPTLWVYSENDKYFGIDAPKQWFTAFRKAKSSSVETDAFFQMPPYKEDGHMIYRCIECWKSEFEKFEAKVLTH
jgi:dienelactone hydrolase